MDDGRGCGVGRRLLRGGSLGVAEPSADPCRVPRRQEVGRWEQRRERAEVGIQAGIDQHRVVDVPRLLPPRVEHHLVPGVVGVQRGHGPLRGVVAHDRADPGGAVRFEAVGGAEERLVLADRPALVVEHGPAAADPAGGDDRSAFVHRSGLDARLGLHDAAEAVGVGQRVLDPSALARGQVEVVGRSREDVHDRALRLGVVASAVKGEQVVHQPGARRDRARSGGRPAGRRGRRRSRPRGGRRRGRSACRRPARRPCPSPRSQRPGRGRRRRPPPDCGWGR